MRVVRSEHRDDARGLEQCGDRFLPYFDRTPGPPQEVEGTAQEVVTCGHAWQRTGVVPVEPNCAGREAIEIRRLELSPAVRTDHVTVETVQQHDDDVIHVHRVPA